MDNPASPLPPPPTTPMKRQNTLWGEKPPNQAIFIICTPGLKLVIFLREKERGTIQER